ncbi:hypothetical protein EYZ11_004897 [Aspergillus tanneri]|uniref:Transcription initiation factor TFIID subunit 9 n=1 Tax=Aspergillus tanneri TaxID=1220188 RepID=A0A4S3JJY4_9EURO|nr:Transcription initiation factor TFIID subunit 9 [Aspergillus tanneri]KAA8651624.1 Transcription initiation factor TFIID subunit 9 [Aspergillus tanneri]THC95635.1 hypothetical protein EYZ11_004897 [Aspergillus tanneri]
MASPNQSQPGGAPSTQPLTPPAEPTTASQQQQSTSTAATASANATATATATATAAAAGPSTTTSAPNFQPTQIPSTSLKDSGKSRRPRDVRLIHMLLASLGVAAYQERVPLQLLDFAYRYTSSVLQDAVHLATEGYAGSTDGTTGRGTEVNSVTLQALRLSIASRLHYQFQTGLPKEFLMDVAAERNRVALPGATRGFDAGQQQKPPANQSVLMGGMRLPPERFCLTGVGWNMKDEWESEGEEEGEGEGEGAAKGGDTMGLAAGQDGEDEDEDEDGEDGKMEDIFGEDTAMGEGDEDGDKTMTDV